jgi:hypothetical protein
MKNIDKKIRAFAQVIAKLEDHEIHNKAWVSLIEYVLALRAKQLRHDPNRVYTQEEALLLFMYDLLFRDDPAGILEIMQTYDSFWDNFAWDEELRLFHPRPVTE